MVIKITDVELTSTSGQFNNLMGQYLMTQYENDKSWGYMDLNGAWSCSPTLAKRTKLAAKFVYGENSEQYQKLDRSTPEGSVGYNQFQNNFNFTEKGNAYYKKANAEGYGLTTEMRKRSVAGALQYANLLGEYVETKDIWSNLKPGAVLGLSYHTAIFVKYAYKNGEVHGMYIWDDHNEERIIYKGGQPPARIGGNFK